MGQLAAFEIAQQILHPLDQALAFGFLDTGQHLGIGEEKIGRAKRIDQSRGGKNQLLFARRIIAASLRCQSRDLFGEHQIGLMEEGIGGLILPRLIGETTVIAGGIGGDSWRCP
jgi:hypothetical protein